VILRSCMALLVFPSEFSWVDGTHSDTCITITWCKQLLQHEGVPLYSAAGDMQCQVWMSWLLCWVAESSNDARAWSHSPIAKVTEQNADMMPVNCHLLGDCTYPLSTSLLMPYRDNGHLFAKQETYNQKLRSKRVVVEQAISLLMNQFSQPR